jgi:lipopolysaccharide/colanic/teichoic acid biosynthesis glycosyltransferase
MDLAIVIVFLSLSLPILAASALALLVTMGRPVLFVQPRSELAGKVCRIY